MIDGLQGVLIKDLSYFTVSIKDSKVRVSRKLFTFRHDTQLSSYAIPNLPLLSIFVLMFSLNHSSSQGVWGKPDLKPNISDNEDEITA